MAKKLDAHTVDVCAQQVQVLLSKLVEDVDYLMEEPDDLMEEAKQEIVDASATIMNALQALKKDATGTDGNE